MVSPIINGEVIQLKKSPLQSPKKASICQALASANGVNLTSQNVHGSPSKLMTPPQNNSLSVQAASKVENSAVQDSEQTYQVCIRVRPPSQKELQ